MSASVSWDAANVPGTLLRVSMPSIMKRTTADAPHSPLFEYVQAQRQATPTSAAGDLAAPVSPALSLASEDSLESMLTATSANVSVADDMPSLSHNPGTGEMAGAVSSAEEAETNHLIYRLCRSLYKKALQKTGRGADVGMGAQDNGDSGAKRQKKRSTRVEVDARHERNMSRVMDWMPLLHLFDPKSFYAFRESGVFTNASASAGPHGPPAAMQLAEVPVGLQRAENPREASRRLLDELEVEKLSGGNSNHVYRLCHPQFPDKSILLRVYGGGDDDAIDRYRDVAAMKQMSRAQLSPAVLHSFKWGRVEEFMENVATGTTDMLIDSPALLAEVYGVLHQMHQLPIEPFFPEAANRARFKSNAVLAETLRDTYDGPQDYLAKNIQRLSAAIGSADGNPVNTSTSSAAAAAAADAATTRAETEELARYYTTETEAKVMEEICPTVFERASLRFLRLTTPSIQATYRKDFIRFVTHEVMQVRGYLQKLAAPIVFSHNDLNPANILLSWRKVPKKFRPLSTPAAEALLPSGLRATGTTSSVGSTTPTRPVNDTLDNDDDEVTSTVSEQSSRFSRKFLTKKGKHKNLVELRGLLFIDFEYSDANYRAIDLGNTICELDYDYSRGMEEGGPGFIKYLQAFPPPTFAAEWADKPEYYPRLPELIYHAWTTQQQQQQQQRDGETLPSASSLTLAKDEGKGGSGSKRDGEDVDIGTSCLRAVATYFAAENAKQAGNGADGAAEKGENKDAPPPNVTWEQLTEVFLGMLATQLHWALWSFTLACNPDTLTNQTDADDDTFAKGSSGLDYVRYGDCRLKEYLCLKTWMAERGMIE